MECPGWYKGPCGACGGTLINKKWILTAGHCCYQIAKERMSFAIGAHYDETCDYAGWCNPYNGKYKNGTGFVVQAKRVIMHPNYRDRPVNWDFALVEIEELDENDNRWQRVYLPESHLLPDIGLGDEETINNNCVVAGWGKTETLKQSSVLLSAPQDIMSGSYCRNVPTYDYRIIKDKNAFCAGKEAGVHDSCSGDSGGPLVCNVDGKTVLYGVVSWGPKACATKGYPGVYAKVSNALEWIKSTIAEPEYKWGKPLLSGKNKGRCGPTFGADCDANGEYPCCNTASGWCGNTGNHCYCSTCEDFREQPKPAPVVIGPECNAAGLLPDDYSGTISVTRSGKTCQKWSEQFPHEHNRTPQNMPGKGLESNYCRNPDNEEGAWCYTTDPDERWDYCPCEKPVLSIHRDPEPTEPASVKSSPTPPAAVKFNPTDNPDYWDGDSTELPETALPTEIPAETTVEMRSVLKVGKPGCWGKCRKEDDYRNNGWCNKCNGYCCRFDGYANKCSQVVLDQVADQFPSIKRHYCIIEEQVAVTDAPATTTEYY